MSSWFEDEGAADVPMGEAAFLAWALGYGDGDGVDAGGEGAEVEVGGLCGGAGAPAAA